MMRSKLFVPASRPTLFDKALVSAADAVSFDLEDAVVERQKSSARSTLRDFLRSETAADCTKLLIVRTNAVDTPHFLADVAAVVWPALGLLNLPKAESVAQVRAAAQAITAAEQANGVHRRVGLLLTIETPAALRHAALLARADPRVVGLQLGLGDLLEPLGMQRSEPAAVQQAMFTLRLAAGECGLPAYDGAYPDTDNAHGFELEARLARRLGFEGKTCIHPKQIALANAVFQPSPEEITHALKVLEATRNGEATGTGAFLVDGAMIDTPFSRRAQATVASAFSLGLLPGRLSPLPGD